MDVAHFETIQLLCGYRQNKTQITVPKSIINITIQKPTLVAVIGKNGTGKTTLLKTLAGLLKPLNGSILINNKQFSELSIKEKSYWISFLPSYNNKIPYIRLNEYIVLGRKHYEWNHKNEQDSLNDLLRKVSLESKAHLFLTQLSDGEMQRAAIARTLARQTPIMMFDEPLAHLDPKQQICILELFKNYTHNLNKIIIFSTHLTDLILSYAHKIWLITENEVIDKIPEQIIIDHDLENNELKIAIKPWQQKSSHFRGCVRLVGDGLAYTYTKYALHRFGINTLCNKIPAFSVIIMQVSNQSHRWLVKKENSIIREFNNLEKLIGYLIDIL